MKIFISTLLFTLIICSNSVQSSSDQAHHDSPPRHYVPKGLDRFTEVLHKFEPYGVRVDQIVYPYGTFVIGRDKKPQFPYPPVHYLDWDTLRRDGENIGRYHNYQMCKLGEDKNPVEVNGQHVEIAARNGDILIREGHRFAIYEDGFHPYILFPQLANHTKVRNDHPSLEAFLSLTGMTRKQFERECL